MRWRSAGGDGGRRGGGGGGGRGGEPDVYDFDATGGSSRWAFFLCFWARVMCRRSLISALCTTTVAGLSEGGECLGYIVRKSVLVGNLAQCGVRMCVYLFGGMCAREMVMGRETRRASRRVSKWAFWFSPRVLGTTRLLSPNRVQHNPTCVRDGAWPGHLHFAIVGVALSAPRPVS